MSTLPVPWIGHVPQMTPSAAWMASTILGIPLRPLQSPSLEHFEIRVRAALAKMHDADGLSVRTVRQRRDAFTRFVEYLRRDALADRFLGGDVESQVRIAEGYISYLRAKNLARATINGYWRGLRSILEVLRRDDGMVNPLVYVKTPRPGRKRLRCLTPEAAARVLRYVQNEASVRPEVRTRNAAVVGVMLLAGLRRAECLALDVSAVDFDAHVVRVEQGKGPDGGKPRTVPMTPQLLALMKAYSARRAKAPVGTPAFFLGSHERARLSEITLTRIFRRVSARTGTHVTPHMLRHTFCTLLSLFGIPDRLAREAMGHADIATLQRYQHVYEGELAAWMQKLALDVS